MRNSRAQSILEYAVIIGIAGAALFAMQLYFRRSVQAVVKLAADEVGCQSEGMLEYDYKSEWKEKGYSETTTSNFGHTRAEFNDKGAVVYEKDDTNQQAGILSRSIFYQK